MRNVDTLYNLALHCIAISYLPSFEYYALTDLRQYLPPAHIEAVLAKMRSIPWDSDFFTKLVFQWSRLKRKHPGFNVFAGRAFRARHLKMRACQCCKIILCLCGE